MAKFLVGVDGGGTTTRAVVARPEGDILGRGRAGPSALRHGEAVAWRAVQDAVCAAFDAAGLARPRGGAGGFDWSDCTLGAGMAGAHHTPWREAFVAAEPGFARLTVDTDSFAMLLGAHAGRPGCLVAAGTGSVAEMLGPDGRRRTVGGWGFPVGDEGSGAWLGLRAMQVAQADLDLVGRPAPGALSLRVTEVCGSDRDALLAWCARAGQFEYAQLAPLVFASEREDERAASLLRAAAGHIDAMARTLDPAGELPIAIGGSIARRLADRLPDALRRRLVDPAAEADVGALWLVRRLEGIA